MTVASINPGLIARRGAIAAALRQIVPDGVVSDESGLTTFDGDALATHRQKPLVCVLPKTHEQVAEILRLAGREGIPIVPRGAGTSLSGGALPLADGILIGMGRMNRILEIDYENGCVVAEPGVTNLNITKAVEAQGFYYAPDPSSQVACTIGGNVSENSGGLHCLKYGLTTNNLLGVKFILPNGELLTLGGKAPGQGGLDLLGVITGGEGLLGMVVEATLRILRKPPVTRTLLAAFNSVPDAGACVAAIIADGLVPAAMEFMDRRCAGAVESYNQPGYPLDAEAILLIDADGVEAEVADAMTRIAAIVRRLGGTATEATDEKQRARMWAGRKAAFAAMGKLAPDMLCMDGTIPRHALPFVLQEIAKLSEKYRLGFCNVFHAGDGNLHPLIVFDVMKDDELARAEAFGADILRLCVQVGGVLSGEHGIGVEKRDLMPEMFTPADLDQQQRLKCAFDPAGLFNPGKVFPTLSSCIEQGHIHVRGAKLPHPAFAALLMTSVSSAAQTEEFVRAATGPFEIVAGGTRRGLGRPLNGLPVLDVSGLAGIVKYEPEELIVTTAPGTPLAEIRSALAEKNQCLGFDPADWSGIWGAQGEATLGGALSADASGPGRLRHGAARDSLLGFQAVNGLGETFRAGGKVVKNVTGFDLPKLVCGAFGTLCILTEITFRVYPRPLFSAMVCLPDIDPLHGFAVLRKIAHSSLEATGLCYLPGTLASPLGDVGRGAALIRLEGAREPLAEKLSALKGLLRHAALREIEDADVFSAIGTGALLSGDLDLWRLAVPPSQAAHVAAQLGDAWLGDWAGGLLWAAASPGEAVRLRALAASVEGHAQLVRASGAMRSQFGLYAPQPDALAAIAARVKAAFDPKSLFNPGRL